jgi:dephospho-CoA kinase
MNGTQARPLLIGLTGGIGSGKSLASGYFSRLGAEVTDADEIVRALLAPGAPGLAPVLDAFGEGLLDEDGALDRARLRRLIFADAGQRRKLEAILHPLVWQEIDRHLERPSDAPYRIVSVPLLVETGSTGRVDRVLLIDCPEELQRSRVAGRPGWSEADAEAAMRSQATREERRRAADDVILNDRGPVELEQAVARLHENYLRLARGRTQAG